MEEKKEDEQGILPDPISARVNLFVKILRLFAIVIAWCLSVTCTNSNFVAGGHLASPNHARPGTMPGRGKDQEKRKPRGAPTEETLQVRKAEAEARKNEERAKNRRLLEASFAKSSRAQTEVAAPPTAAMAPAPASAPAPAAAPTPAETPTPASEPQTPAASDPVPAVPVPELPLGAYRFWDHPRRREQNLPDVEAELEDDSQLAGGIRGGGIMHNYLRAVHERLKAEVSAKNPRALLPMLEASDWWLRASDAPKICQVPELEVSEVYYYRDIHVWLPDLRWGVLPPCPCCGSASRVGAHCWRDNHFGRRIVGLETNYFVISRRYKCHACEEDAKSKKSAAERAAAGAGIRVVVEDEAMDVDGLAESEGEAPQYTYMGWDQGSRELLPFGFNLKFPAFLTYNAGVDLTVLDMMRPLSDKGVRP